MEIKQRSCTKAALICMQYIYIDFIFVLISFLTLYIKRKNNKTWSKPMWFFSKPFLIRNGLQEGYVSHVFPWHNCLVVKNLIWISHWRDRRDHTTRNKHLPMHLFNFCPLKVELRLEKNLLNRWKGTISWNFKWTRGLQKQMTIHIATCVWIAQLASLECASDLTLLPFKWYSKVLCKC